MYYAQFTQEAPTRSLTPAEDLLRATEAAARAAAPWIGEGDKLAADKAAVDAMHNSLVETGLSCRSVNCEGEKDGAKQLDGRAVYGSEGAPRYDLAADPVEGTTFVALGQPGGMSIAALGERGRLLPWIGAPYMRKLVVGPRAAELLDTPLELGGVDIRGKADVNMQRVAAALGKDISELTVAMLDRDRNADIREAAERIGARVLLLEGGDVTPALQTCIGREVDMLYSSGGAPEGVITAAAIAALGGNMQAKVDPRTPAETQRAVTARMFGKVLNLRSLIGDGEVHFSATGITDSPLLTGARYAGGEWHPGSSILLSRPPQHSRRQHLLQL